MEQIPKPKNPHRMSDIMIILAILFALICHAATNYINGEYIQKGKLVEMNPFADKILEAEPKIRYIFSLVIMPGMFLGLYYYMRKKIRDPFIINSYTMMFVVITLINAINDVSILVGLL